MSTFMQYSCINGKCVEPHINIHAVFLHNCAEGSCIGALGWAVPSVYVQVCISGCLFQHVDFQVCMSYLVSLTTLCETTNTHTNIGAYIGSIRHVMNCDEMQ
jgi:hypothetical protein